MIKIEILIPLADNDGTQFSEDHHRVFEGLLVRLFGGYSRLPGHVAGGWRDEVTDRVFTDYSIAYVVAIASITKADVLSEIAGFAKSHYRQLAIYISYLGVAEIL